MPICFSLSLVCTFFFFVFLEDNIWRDTFLFPPPPEESSEMEMGENLNRKVSQPDVNPVAHSLDASNVVFLTKNKNWEVSIIIHLGTSKGDNLGLPVKQWPNKNTA